MKTNIIKHLFSNCLLALIFFLTACSDDTPETKPVITSFSPTSGPPGQQVVITGKNFSQVPAENFVVFNGTAQGLITGVSATSLTVRAPLDVTTGKILVTVNGQSAESAEEFVVLGPSITSFSPMTGTPGTSITITGSNFSNVKAQNTVTINGTAATVEEASLTELTITVPNGATTGKIAVTFAGRMATSTEDFEVQ